MKPWAVAAPGRSSGHGDGASCWPPPCLHHRRAGQGGRCRARYRGFTLIELSIVVFILAMLVATSVPNFVRSYNAALLNETARSFATLCQLARIQAVSQQQNATLHVDLERQVLWVSQPARKPAASAFPPELTSATITPQLR